MNKFLYSVYISLFISLSWTAEAQSFPNPASLSTGQGAANTFDPIWTVSQWYSTSPPNPMGLTYTPALINNNCAPGAWVDPSALPPPTNNGKWITGTSSPCAGNTNDGYLYFRLTLDLPTDCNGNSVATAGNYVLHFSGYVDNTISDVFVNGNSTGISGGAFAAGSQLTITLPGPWIPGVNYVDIMTYNFPNGGSANPYGLLLVADATASTVSDGDNDNVADIVDQCPCNAGPSPSGCPPAAIAGSLAICPGGSTTLTATGGGTYRWSDNSTNSTLTVSPASTTPYSVTTTSSTGFTSSASVNVTVNTVPAAAITPATAAICSGGNTTLTASGGTGYIWSTSAITAPITVSPALATTYTVTVTDGNNCTAAASRLVTVNSLPVAGLTPAAAAVCTGKSTALTATGGTSYLWSTTATTAAITVSPTTATTYTVTVTNSNNCTVAASRTVTVNPLPTPGITPASVAICTGGSTILTASGGTGYIWSTTATTAAISVSPTGTATYTVTVTDANTCSATASKSVTVNPLPTPAISPATAAICNGASTTLIASGGTGYAWSTTAATAAITISPASTTSYSVTVTDANTCSASATRSVTVNALPTAIINPTVSTICNGKGATLTASGGTSYVWNTTATTAAITVSPATATIYTVTVTNANNCTAAASRTVNVNPLPTPGITPASVAICSGGSTTLTASGGTGYLWSTTATTAAITVSPAGTATYTVTVTDANTCSATASRSVTVNPLPVATISPATATICHGASTTLTATGGTSYLWSTNATTAPATVSPASTTSYSVTVTDANTCSASATRSVTVNQLPVPTITPAVAAICVGGSITLTAAGGNGYAWSNADATAATSVSPGATTTYTVTVTNANNCSATASRLLTVNPLPTLIMIPSSIAICAGGSTTLTVSGGTSFAWSNAANTASTTVSPAALTTYTVTVTDANTCSATTSATVTVNPLPTPAISPASAAICTGGSTTLTASGGISYTWSNTDNTVATNVSPTTLTTYTVTVTDANTCSASVSAIVTVNPLPTPSVGPASTAICIGGSTTLTAGGGTSYMWSNTEITASTNVSPTGNTTYTVTVTDANTCSATASGTVTVNALPTPSVNPSSIAICAGDITTLTASGGTGFLWSNTDITAATAVSPAATAIYTVTVTDANTCSATASATVTVNQLPVPVINPLVPAICIGANATLTASGGTSYTWSTTDNTAGITISPLTTTPYTVTVTDANICSATTSVTLTVNPLPLAAISPSAISICEGTGTVLTASGGVRYAWSTAETTATNNAAPNITTTYTVTVTDANACWATATSTVTVNTLPTATISPSSARICMGSNTTLTAGGGVSYTWDNGGTAANPTVSPTITTTYTVTVTDANNCTSNAWQSITVVAPMVLNASKTDITCNGVNNGAINLTVNSGLAPYGYLWNIGGTVEDPNGLATGTYTVTVTDNAGCTAATAASIAAPQALSVAPVSVNPTCATLADDGSIILNAGGGTAPYAYTWSNGDTSDAVSNLGEGSYSVIISDLNNCTAQAAFTLVYIYDFAVHATPAVTIGLAESATLTYTTTGNPGTLVSVWSPSESLSCSDCAAPVASPGVSTTYQIEVRNSAGCTASDTTSIFVIPDYTVFIPNAFTPNGDGNNDLFQIYGNKKAVKYLEVEVFNRWGETVFKSFDIDFGWDGSYKGGMLEPGMLVWQVKTTFLDGHSDDIKKGSLTLIR